jgi:hypothetical protein
VLLVIDLHRLHCFFEFDESRHMLIRHHLAAGLDADLRRVAVQMSDQHRADDLIELGFFLDDRFEP